MLGYRDNEKLLLRKHFKKYSIFEYFIKKKCTFEGKQSTRIN